MEDAELIIQCGLTYQPLTIAISLLSESYDIRKVHIVTTHSAMKGVEEVMDSFFASLNYTVYGEFVDGGGSDSDQSEYVTLLRQIREGLGHQPLAVVASGTNWMTYHFARELDGVPTFVVKTAKAFEEKSFFPQYEKVAVSECGEVAKNDGKTPIVYLQRLCAECNKKRFFVKERSLFFLGHEIELTLQEAAMFAFLAYCGGAVDLENDYTAQFNAFCESHQSYDNYRVFVDEFTGRFRQTVSKINSKLQEYPPIVQKHLTIERKGSRYEINPSVLD
jgi:hypothetical protein